MRQTLAINHINQWSSSVPTYSCLRVVRFFRLWWWRQRILPGLLDAGLSSYSPDPARCEGLFFMFLIVARKPWSCYRLSSNNHNQKGTRTRRSAELCSGKECYQTTMSVRLREETRLTMHRPTWEDNSKIIDHGLQSCDSVSSCKCLTRSRRNISPSYCKWLTESQRKVSPS